jgi:hypothetical protein
MGGRDVKIFKRSPFRRYPGTVYAIRTARRRAGPFGFDCHLGYVGKTRKRPYTKRINEHRRTQPWSDLIISHRVLWTGTCTDFHLWWLEIYYILTRFPVYNYQWNRWNPRRVPVYRARTQRGIRNGLRHYRGGQMGRQDPWT